MDIRDFKNFRSEYAKLVIARKTMAIFITMKKKDDAKPVNKRKKR
jgi:hypothetical protein